MGILLSVEEEKKPQTIVTNNYNTQSSQQQQQQIKQENNYELSLVLMALWSIPTIILCCIHKYQKYGHGSIFGFVIGFLFKMSLK